MDYASIDEFFKAGKAHLNKGPIALIFAEDQKELASTIIHHTKLGFVTIIVFARSIPILSSSVQSKIISIQVDLFNQKRVPFIINKINELALGQWVYYCYNGEYLFYPFCETRSVTELLDFHSEERRDAMLTFVVDLYAADLSAPKGSIMTETCLLDGAGYFATARLDPDSHQPLDRQLDYFGGLRWRFEEYVPFHQRKIDRISIFKTCKGLRICPDYTFNVPEYNTRACPWHSNLTAAIVSFRAAKALLTNPDSKSQIKDLTWQHSVPFSWTSEQLLHLGLIEPGQWF